MLAASSLLIGGTVVVGAVARQNPAVDLARVQPVARLTSDYLVVVVAADSPIRSVSDLAACMRVNPKTVPVAGGSAGGVDHMFVGVFAKGAGSNPDDLAYLPFASGPRWLRLCSRVQRWPAFPATASSANN